MTAILGFGLLAALVVAAAVVGHWLLRRTDRNDDATHGGGLSSPSELP